MNAIRCFMIFTLLALLPATGHAKWWIFGQSENEISTRYLYLNGVSYDELGEKVMVYRETLPEGRLVLRGKAGTTSSQIGVVQVSRDGKETWQKAGRSDDGTFEYSFVPEINKSYLLYVKIMDTTGKSNDVEATRKEVTVSDENISAAIKKAMDGLISAYRGEDPRSFMTYVSPDFSADATILDRAIRKDFSIFDNIDLRYTLNNVTSAGNGRVFAAFSYTSQMTEVATGKTSSRSGSTEFIFNLEEGGAKVFAMKNPLIFGLSDPENVSSGDANGYNGTDAEPLPTNFPPAAPKPPKPSGDDEGLAKATDIEFVDLSMKHHMITLSFSTATTSPYTVAVEEATSPGGPWTRLSGPDVTLTNPTTVRVMSNNIAQKAIFLYYRLFIVKGGEESRPSTVIEWDNR